MRQITKEAKNAFMHGHNFNKSNTMVIFDETKGITKMYLHGNLIAKYHSVASDEPQKGLFITNAGWFSNVTKERLNAFPFVNIYQKNFVWYLNDQEWDGKWIHIK